MACGILTAHCPALDLDIRDKEVVRVLIELAGDVPFRVGAAPKALLPFSAAIHPHRIEILGDGQQFVAYAQHRATRSTGGAAASRCTRC